MLVNILPHKYIVNISILIIIRFLSVIRTKGILWHKRKSLLFFFLGHMEVPRLGVGTIAASLHHSHSNSRSEPPLQSTWQLSNARSLTHWMRPWIKPTSSWILVRFISTELQWELLKRKTLNWQFHTILTKVAPPMPPPLFFISFCLFS